MMNGSKQARPHPADGMHADTHVFHFASAAAPFAGQRLLANFHMNDRPLSYVVPMKVVVGCNHQNPTESSIRRTSKDDAQGSD